LKKGIRRINQTGGEKERKSNKNEGGNRHGEMGDG
jgi:hypothetical protein